MSNTITVEVPVTPEKKSVEIKLPAFRKYGKSTFYKIAAFDCCVMVSTFTFHASVEVYNKAPHLALSVESFPITEEEFTSALNSTLQKINEAVKH